MVNKKEHIFEEDVEKRWCGKCKTYKPLDNFGYSKSTWDNLRPTCKECLHEQNMSEKEKRTEYNKQYWEKTKDKQSEKNKQWRQENPERVKENMQKWLENNTEYKKQKDKEYREKHKEEYRENHRRWVKENYARMKAENGPEFIQHKLKSNISRRIREIIGQQKSDRCNDYVGCSIENLKQHLESTFTDGMSWENYGQWHIDHKIPCAAFDLSNDLEMKACFHYKNLQALWARDNVIKKDKFNIEEKNDYIKNFQVSKVYGVWPPK